MTRVGAVAVAVSPVAVAVAVAAVAVAVPVAVAVTEWLDNAGEGARFPLRRALTGSGWWWGETRNRALEKATLAWTRVQDQGRRVVVLRETRSRQVSVDLHRQRSSSQSASTGNVERRGEMR